MEELALQSIIEMALGNEMQAKDYVSKHVKGAARWYYDEKESILTAQKIDSIRYATDPEYRKLKDSLKEHLTAPDPNSDLYKL